MDQVASGTQTPAGATLTSLRSSLGPPGTEIDRREGLRSIPARFGVAGSLWIARALHVGAFAALVALYWVVQLGSLALVGVLATGVLLIYQHTLVRADDLSRLNAAFFTTNAFVSVILFATFGGAVLIRLGF